MKILISGGGIAGLGAALFLGRLGHDVEVIDRAPSFQKRGYAITLKGFGLRVMDELGLRAALSAHEIRFETLRICDASARPLQVIPQQIAQEITHGQILTYRSEVHAVLYEAARTLVPIRFGLHVAAIDQDDRRARATLSDGTVGDHDLVIVAEGMRSSTRRLLFGDECVRPFDVAYAAATIHLAHGLDPRAAHAYAGDEQNVVFMPIDAEHLLVQCYFRGEPGAPRHARARLLEAFGGFAPVVQRLLEAIPEDGDVFSDRVAMIELPTLSRGRVVLLGDAAYCPTFLSGMGASLGLLGAKVLADALPAPDAPPDLGAALARYEGAMRPLVRRFQANAVTNVANALPTSHVRLLLRNWLMHHAPSALLARHFGKQFDVDDALLEPLLCPSRLAGGDGLAPSVDLG